MPITVMRAGTVLLLLSLAVAGEPEEVADQVVAAMDEERFLILTDPIAQEWMEGKTTDPDRWLRGMNRMQQRIEDAETSKVTSTD